MSNTNETQANYYQQYIEGVDIREVLRYGMSEFPHRSDNVIHFQDPRSAKFNGTLQKPLRKTKNERNYTTYNFTKPELTPKDPVRYVRRVKEEVYRDPTKMKLIINLPSKTNPEKRDKSETERKSVARNLESSAMQGCLGTPKSVQVATARRPRSKMREFIDSSGVACLQ